MAIRFFTPWLVDRGPFSESNTVRLHACTYQVAFSQVNRMEAEKCEIRVILRFMWKTKLSAAAAAREICQVEGQGTVSARTARKWFKRLNEGSTSIEDDARSKHLSATARSDDRCAINCSPIRTTNVL